MGNGWEPLRGILTGLFTDGQIGTQKVKFPTQDHAGRTCQRQDTNLNLDFIWTTNSEGFCYKTTRSYTNTVVILLQIHDE